MLENVCWKSVVPMCDTPSAFTHILHPHVWRPLGHSGPRHSHGHVRIHKGGWAGKEQVLTHLNVWPFKWFAFFARKALQMIGVTCLGYRIAIMKVLVSRALVACNLGSTSSLTVVWNGLTLSHLFLNGMHSLHRNWIYNSGSHCSEGI